jgi:hypothetical protein
MVDSLIIFFILKIEFSNPLKIASLIKKWPIFNSFILGIDAIKETFSKFKPWPA